MSLIPSYWLTIVLFVLTILQKTVAWSHTSPPLTVVHSTTGTNLDRRQFLSAATSTLTLVAPTFLISTSASAASVGTESSSTSKPIQILTTPSGIKYAITKQATNVGKKVTIPQKGDFVAIEYTGYLTNGQIFDSTHAEGKSNALLFTLGSQAVIPGLNEILSLMQVGEKVQAIIPPSLAFGSEGICLEKEDGTKGDCLIPPNSTLVYDVFLKKTSIPPP